MEQYIIEGSIAVKAALLANRRQMLKLYVDETKRDKNTVFILQKAKQAGIAILPTKRTIIDTMAKGTTHGGILALCGPRRYQKLSELPDTKATLLLALIEGVEDPFNFGYILRTLYAAGCDGIIVPKRNWSTAADVVAKASAGASEYINMIVADDMEATLQELKKRHIPLICAQRKDAISLYDYRFPAKVCIAIGGEMRGLSKLVQTNSAQNLFIPYRSDFRNAMTAASSTAIFAFEWLRQHTPSV